MDSYALYVNAIELWGEHTQMLLAVEEMAELSKAIMKFFRTSGYGEKRKIEEELADVEIMIEQLKLIVKSAHVDYFRRKKLERLEKRIEAEFKKKREKI